MSSIGYFLGGKMSIFYATTDKVSYSNDSVSAVAAANLKIARADISSISSGYLSGYTISGNFQTSSPTNTTFAEKINYSTDQSSSVASAKSNLLRMASSVGLSQLGIKGYLTGGVNNIYLVNTEKLIYVIDTNILCYSGSLSVGKSGVSCLSDYYTKGFYSGGYKGTSCVVDTEKVLYSSDVPAIQSSSHLQAFRSGAASLSKKSGTSGNGYVFGGSNNGSFAGKVATSESFNYTTELFAISDLTLSSARINTSGISNLATKGYVAGGYCGANVYVNTVDKILYSISIPSRSVCSNTLSQSRQSMGSLDQYHWSVLDYYLFLSHPPIYCYNMGGYSTSVGYFTYGEVIYSSTGVVSAAMLNLPPEGSSFSAVSETDGYNVFITGGWNGISVNSSLQRLNATTGIIDEVSPSALHAPRINMSNTSSSTMAYLAGGNTYETEMSNSIESLNFSSYIISTTSLILNQGRQLLCGVSNRSTHGYFSGGYYTDYLTNIGEKLTFSVPSISNCFAAGLTTARDGAASVEGGSIKAYYCGGERGVNGTPVSSTTCDRVLFSLDTTNIVTTAVLSTARYRPSGFSNCYNNGYILGGWGSSDLRSIDKLNLFNDQLSINSSSLTYARRGSACGGHVRLDNISSANGAYFIGGSSGSITYRCDKVLFNTDTLITWSGLSNLTVPTYRCGGISDGSRSGYVAGGINSSYITTTSIWEVSFSTDYTSLCGTMALSVGRQAVCGLSGSSIYGYFGGGFLSNGADMSTVDKFQYSTKTRISPFNVYLYTPRSYLVGVGNRTLNGYFIAGLSGSSISNLSEKLLYSTESLSSCPSANLLSIRYAAQGVSSYGATTSNINNYSRNCYIVGGTDGVSNLTSTEKINSLDIISNCTTARLYWGKAFGAGASNAITKGYFVGGTDFSHYPSILNFSTESISNATSAYLSQVVAGRAGIGLD